MSEHQAASVTALKKSPLQKQNTLLKRIRRYKFLYILMIPGLLWYIVFHIMPLYGIVIAFQDFSPMLGVAKSPWVGLEHFKTLVTSQTFLRVLKNTVWISALKLFVGFPFPIILAIMIFSVQNRFFKKIVQTFTLMPNFLSWVIITGIAFVLFNKFYGVVAVFFKNVGWTYTDPTTTVSTFIPFLVSSAIWKGVGMSSVIYLASLSGINPELYEAATVDGAGKFKQLLHITIPCLMPTCAIVFILSVGSLMSGDFEQIYLFAKENREVWHIADIFETFVYRNGIRAGNYSFPAAVGIFQSFFGAFLVLGTNKLAKKLGNEGIW